MAKLKCDSRTKEWAGEICGATVCGFDATVTSTGQHDMAPPREGLGSLGFAGILAAEWCGQFSMPAIRSGWAGSGEALRAESAWACGEYEFTSCGSVQPMRQASTASHRDIIVAIAGLKLWIGEGIAYRLYRGIRENNVFCGAVQILF